MNGISSRGPHDELQIEALGGVRIATLNRVEAMNAVPPSALRGLVAFDEQRVSVDADLPGV